MSKWPSRTREEATNGDKEAGVNLCSAEGLGVFTDCRKTQREDSAQVNIHVPGD